MTDRPVCPICGRMSLLAALTDPNAAFVNQVAMLLGYPPGSMSHRELLDTLRYRLRLESEEADAPDA